MSTTNNCCAPAVTNSIRSTTDNCCACAAAIRCSRSPSEAQQIIIALLLQWKAAGAWQIIIVLLLLLFVAAGAQQIIVVLMLPQMALIWSTAAPVEQRRWVQLTMMRVVRMDSVQCGWYDGWYRIWMGSTHSQGKQYSRSRVQVTMSMTPRRLSGWWVTKGCGDEKMRCQQQEQGQEMVYMARGWLPLLNVIKSCIAWYVCVGLALVRWAAGQEG